ncbi:uncharacterized protein LOC131331262 isoform X2 [Rhododendron vialii]|nr:uncharacterized protein LOC131331262 isoform X2 [Rhododendron vialii]
MRGASPSSPLTPLGISHSHLNDSTPLSESLTLSTSLSLTLSVSLAQVGPLKTPFSFSFASFIISCSTTSGYKEGKAAGMASLQHTSINTTVLCKKGAISVMGVSALLSSLSRFRTIVGFARVHNGNQYPNVIRLDSELPLICAPQSR